MIIIHFTGEQLSLDFYKLGVYPREIKGLLGIITHPLIHSSWGHLLANSSSLFFLLATLIYFYKDWSYLIFFLIWITEGTLLFIIGRENWHIGASGIIYGLAFFLFFSGVFSLSDSIRHAAFQVVSYITTTGFTSTNYSTWPLFSQTVLYVLCFVGGCAGSTGGGIKVVRIGAMMKLFKNSIVKRLHPNATTVVRLGDDTISSSTMQAIAGFVGFYITNVIIGTLVLSLTGIDFLAIHTSVLLTLGNIGVGLGGIGTDFTFAVYPQWALWCFSWLMLVGRLELFTVYAIFTREFWKR